MIIRRLCLLLIAILVLTRAAGYLTYVRAQIRTPREVGDLESKLAHLAWRVQAGERFYPEWRDYPHVTNFFSPVYFLIVGETGALTHASLHNLFVIGRTVTVLCALATTALVGGTTARREGAGPGLVAAIASLGAAPMVGAALMVRPDTMAELFGVAGFALAVGSKTWHSIAGAALLLIAVFTKQTAIIFAIAAAMTLLLSGRPRTAAGLLVAMAGGVLLIVGAITRIEPLFAVSLLGEGRTPWSRATWTALLAELATSAPDLLVVPLIGAALWAFDRPRQLAPIVLWIVVLFAGLVTAAKVGSGLNYFLSLRVVEALAVATIWKSSTGRVVRRPRLAVAALVVIAALLVPGVLLSLRTAQAAVADAQFYSRRDGQRFLANQRELFSLAENPGVNLLTDSGLLQLYQKERAAFVDPFQFKNLVESKEVEPQFMIRQLETESYDRVITTSDLFRPEYDANVSGLPFVLAESARAQYALRGRTLGLFIYTPRTRPTAELPGDPIRPRGRPVR